MLPPGGAGVECPTMTRSVSRSNSVARSTTGVPLTWLRNIVNGTASLLSEFAQPPADIDRLPLPRRNAPTLLTARSPRKLR
jgi:hypothetical protein